MPAYAIWLDSTTTPPTATVAQIPNPLPGSGSTIGAYRTMAPTANARCIGYVATADAGAKLPSPRWTPLP
jgi:hypothetical protein